MNNQSSWLENIPPRLRPSAEALARNSHSQVDVRVREEMTRYCARLPVSVVTALAHDPAPRVRCKLADYLKQPPELFYTLAHDSANTVAYTLLDNHHCPPGAIHNLFGRYRSAIAPALLEDNPTEVLLVKFVRHSMLPLEDLLSCPALTVLTRGNARLDRLFKSDPSGLVDMMSAFVGSDAAITFAQAIELTSLTLKQPV